MLLAIRLFIPITAFICISLHPTFGQIIPHYPARNYDALSFRDAFWIATPANLYEYRSAENTWSVRSPSNGLLSSTISKLAREQDVLWVGQDAGITKYDAQSNTMLSYRSGTDLPSGTVLSFAFETDYVWAGLERGAARYDKLIEQWEILDRKNGLVGDSVLAISPRGNLVYLFTNEAVNEYDSRYERWRTYKPVEAAIGARDAFLTSMNAWLLCEREMLRFDFVTRGFQRYSFDQIGSFADILGITIEGDNFWILTRNSLWYYDFQSDIIRPFLEIENLPDKDIAAVAFTGDGSVIWFSTRTGISQYDRNKKAWSYFTEAGGLPATDFSALFSFGNEVIGISKDQIVYYKPKESRWYSFAVQRDISKAPDNKFSLDPMEGTYLVLDSGIRLSLSGSRSSWLIKQPLDNSEIIGRNDLKAKIEIGNDRSINATYNDADFSDVVYGAQYRGARDDIVQTIQWGDIRVDQGSRILMQSFGVFGGGTRIALGDRTPRYHRSFFEASAVGGHKTTAITTDFFNGKTRKTQTEIRDVDFRRRQFYVLDTSFSFAPVDPSQFELFMTRPQGAPATNNILPDTIIAGIAGSWIQLYAFKDYYLDSNNGIVRLNQPLPSGAALAARFIRDGQSVTLLLAGQDTSTCEIYNYYFLKGTSIIPLSLTLTFIDFAGNSIPLSFFGLDNNNDSRIDPEFVDFKNGFLRFPSAKPFPSSVYDSSISSVLMRVNFETQSTGYTLSHDRIVRGAERILVDGRRVTAGDDYVLDYTSGYLLFIRDGIVSDDSRIEIRYEYIRHRIDERFVQVSAALSPSDYSQLGTTFGMFRPEGSGKDVYFVHSSLEGRFQTEDFDLRLLPEFSRTMSDTLNGNAAAILSTFSTNAIRVSAQTRYQTEQFAEPFHRLFPLGKVRNETYIGGEYDFSSSLRAFVNYSHRKGIDSAGINTARDESSSAGLQFSVPCYPTLIIRAENFNDNVMDLSHHRQSVRGDIEYIACGDFLSMTGLTSAYFSSYIRYSHETENLPGGYSNNMKLNNYFFRIAVSPRPLFIFNTYYWADIQKRTNDIGFYPYLTIEKLYSDLVMEHIRGIALGMRFLGAHKKMQSSVIYNTYDIDNKSSFQLSSRISPGIILPFLQLFTFEFNFRNEYQYYSPVEDIDVPLFLSFFKSAPLPQTTRSETRIIDAKIEFRPSSEIIYSISGSSTRFSNRILSSGYVEYQSDLLQRLDLRPSNLHFYSLQFNVLNTENPWSSNARYSPILWAENRWNKVLLTRFSLTMMYDERKQGLDEIKTYDATPSANVTLSFSDLPVIRRADFRDDITFHYTKTIWDPAPFPTMSGIRFSKLITNSIYLDIYPHPIAYLRAQYSQHWDLISNDSFPKNSRTVSIQLVVQL